MRLLTVTIRSSMFTEVCPILGVEFTIITDISSVGGYFWGSISTLRTASASLHVPKQLEDTHRYQIIRYGKLRS